MSVDENAFEEELLRLSLRLDEIGEELGLQKTSSLPDSSRLEDHQPSTHSLTSSHGEQSSFTSNKEHILSQEHVNQDRQKSFQDVSSLSPYLRKNDASVHHDDTVSNKECPEIDHQSSTGEVNEDSGFVGSRVSGSSPSPLVRGMKPEDVCGHSVPSPKPENVCSRSVPRPAPENVLRHSVRRPMPDDAWLPRQSFHEPEIIQRHVGTEQPQKYMPHVQYDRVKQRTFEMPVYTRDSIDAGVQYRSLVSSVKSFLDEKRLKTLLMDETTFPTTPPIGHSSMQNASKSHYPYSTNQKLWNNTSATSNPIVVQAKTVKEHSLQPEIGYSMPLTPHRKSGKSPSVLKLQDDLCQMQDYIFDIGDSLQKELHTPRKGKVNHEKISPSKLSSVKSEQKALSIYSPPQSRYGTKDEPTSLRKQKVLKDMERMQVGKTKTARHGNMQKSYVANSATQTDSSSFRNSDVDVAKELTNKLNKLNDDLTKKVSATATPTRLCGSPSQTCPQCHVSFDLPASHQQHSPGIPMSALLSSCLHFICPSCSSTSQKKSTGVQPNISTPSNLTQSIPLTTQQEKPLISSNPGDINSKSLILDTVRRDRLIVALDDAARVAADTEKISKKILRNMSADLLTSGMCEL